MGLARGQQQRADAHGRMRRSERSHGAVTYITGGIGTDEADAFRRAAAAYALRRNTTVW